MCLQNEDWERTISVNTGDVSSSEIHLEENDRLYLIQVELQPNTSSQFVLNTTTILFTDIVTQPHYSVPIY